MDVCGWLTMLDQRRTSSFSPKSLLSLFLTRLVSEDTGNHSDMGLSFRDFTNALSPGNIWDRAWEQARHLVSQHLLLTDLSAQSKAKTTWQNICR